MERMLQYVWKHRLFEETELMTAEGVPVFVIDPGMSNMDAGPDFFNAKVRIGDTMWAGNVEIHERASDWFTHRHHKDKAYNSVILHVVRHPGKPVHRADGIAIPQVVLKIPSKIESNIEWLLSRDASVSCAERIRTIPPLYLSDWMGALLTERLERKTNDIFVRLEQHSKDWNEMFYITLMRNFGFGTNSDAFELLAKSLPYKYILKHRHNPLQVEALLFGQAGLLNDEVEPMVVEASVSVPPVAATADPYLQALRREYDFLRKKYQLRPVEAFLFKKLRTRPVNFPHIRLAQAAAVWVNQDLLFSKVLDTEDIGKLKEFFNVTPSDYWTTHYNFRSVSAAGKKNVGKKASDILLINTVIPVLFAYGKYKDIPAYCERALQFLEDIPAEQNYIVTIFNYAGISVKNAGDTQALIQLRREYCDRKKCLYCRIGFRIIDNECLF